MVNKNKILLCTLLVLIVMGGQALAQEWRIEHGAMPPGVMTTEQLSTFSIYAPTAMKVSVVVTATGTKLGQVARITTEAFDVHTGANVYTTASVPPIAEIWIAPQFKSMVSQTGMFPEDYYTILIQLFDKNKTELVDGRFIHQVFYPQIRMCAPTDGDTISTLHPLFQWLISRPIPGIEYNLRIFEIMPGQTKADAINNLPHFEQKGIRTPSFIYPLSAKAYDPGKQYCCQLTAYVNNYPIVSKESEPIIRFVVQSASHTREKPKFTIPQPPSQPDAELEIVLPSSAIDWGDGFSVGAQVTNTGDGDIKLTEGWVYFLGPLGVWFPFPLHFRDSLMPSGTSRDLNTSGTFSSKNQWWTDYVVLPLHDLSYPWRCYVTAAWSDPDGNRHDLRSPATGDTSVTIQVPQWKIDEANLASAFLGLADFWAALAIEYAGMGEEIDAFLAEVAWASNMETYSQHYATMQDPPVPDMNFRSVARLRPLLLSLPEGKKPFEKACRQVVLSQRNLVAAYDFFDISCRRSWGAFVSGENQSLLQQAKANSSAANLCKKAASQLAGDLLRLANEVEKAGISLSREQIVEFQQKIGKEGLSKEEIDLLDKWGYGRDIEFFTRALEAVDPDKASQFAQNLRDQANHLREMSKSIGAMTNEVQGLTRVKTEQERHTMLLRGGLLKSEEMKKGETKITPK